MAKRDDKARVSGKQESSSPSRERTGKGHQVARGRREATVEESLGAQEKTSDVGEQEGLTAEVAAQPQEERQQEREELIEIAAGELEQLKAEKEEHYDRLLRLKAEFENYKKRVQKDFDAFRKYAAENVIEELLPVLDNFERALGSVPEGVNDGFREGIEIIHRQLRETLGKAGLSPMETVGHEFDPNLHEALMQVPSDDHEEGIVVEEFHKGYTLFDKVIRHAKVAVSGGNAKKEEPNAAAEHEMGDEQEAEDE